MIKTEPWTGGTDEEYETQHFGFGSQRFKIALRQMILQNIEKRIEDMQQDLQETLKLNDTDKETLTRSCNKLLRLYCEAAGPSLEHIDLEVKRIIQVPPNVLLSADEVQQDQITDSEYKKLKDEVENLRKQVERGAMMNSLLLSEHTQLTAAEEACELAEKDMDAVDLLCKNIEADNLEGMIRGTKSLQAWLPSVMQVDKENNDSDEIDDN